MNAGLYLFVVIGDTRENSAWIIKLTTTTSHTTLMHSGGARSIHIVDSNLTSSAIEQTRKELLLRTCANGFPFSRKLVGHKSCVNILSFSRNGGKWLASGGDDFRVQLWDFNQDDVRRPSQTYAGPAVRIRLLGDIWVAHPG